MRYRDSCCSGSTPSAAASVRHPVWGSFTYPVAFGRSGGDCGCVPQFQTFFHRGGPLALFLEFADAALGFSGYLSGSVGPVFGQFRGVACDLGVQVVTDPIPGPSQTSGEFGAEHRCAVQAGGHEMAVDQPPVQGAPFPVFAEDPVVEQQVAVQLGVS